MMAPMRNSIVVAVSLVAGVAMHIPLTARSQTDTTIIDDCRYENNASAQAAWLPMQGSAPAEAANADGRKVLRLRCNFAGTQIERASWDRRSQLDLTECRGIRFNILCADSAPVSHFSLYFRSGDGWYAAGFFPQASGWNTISIDKAGTRTEGKPAGWGHINAIRISAWRGSNADTKLCLSDVRMNGALGLDSFVAIVRGDSAAASPGEADSVTRYAEIVAQCLESQGIGAVTISDMDVASERLKKARVVVLPHNPAMPDRVANETVKYLNGGGTILTFYGMHPTLRRAVGIEGGAHVKQEYPGHFSSMRFVPGALPGAPPVVGQRSWNIVIAKPVPGVGRVLAEWLNDKGEPSGYAAIVGSSNCLAMSHVLLPDDPVNKRRMLAAMVCRLAPELWKQAADACISRMGQVAGCATFDEAAARISKTAGSEAGALTALADARRLRKEALKLHDNGRFCEASDIATEAAHRMTEAHCAAQQPLKGEFRAFWCHNAFGVEGMDWDSAIKRLADNGFTAIIPNMLWGGAAYYDGKVLPVAPETKTRGDQIAQCLAACRKHGLQIHVWKVNWHLGRAPREFVEKLRREGRLQADSKGAEELWLCPSHPDNRRLEIDAMVEVARNYDVDGIHFDYIRYPDGDHCFCGGCKERFQKALKVDNCNFPRDALTGGALRRQWLDWRRDNITEVVKAISEQARTIRPSVRISAAVFRNWSTDRDTVGQDWKLWCEKGYLDFVCPMDYTENDAQFDNWVAQQKIWAGKTPCYPGIGASASSSSLGAERVIGQINITRKHDARGFVIFNYGSTESRDLLPMLGKGITARR